MGGKSSKTSPLEYITVMGAEVPMTAFHQIAKLDNEDLAALANTLTYNKNGFPTCTEDSSEDLRETIHVCKLMYKILSEDTTSREFKLIVKKKMEDLTKEDKRKEAITWYKLPEDDEEIKYLFVDTSGIHLSKEQQDVYNQRMDALVEKIRARYEESCDLMDDIVMDKAEEMEDILAMMEKDLVEVKEEEAREELEDHRDSLDERIAGVKAGTHKVKKLIYDKLNQLERLYSLHDKDVLVLAINGASTEGFKSKEDILALVVPEKEAVLTFMMAPMYSLSQRLCETLMSGLDYSAEYPCVSEDTVKSVKGTEVNGMVVAGSTIFTVNGFSCKGIKDQDEMKKLLNAELEKQTIVLPTVNGTYMCVNDRECAANHGHTKRWVHLYQENISIQHDKDVKRWLLTDCSNAFYCTQESPGNNPKKWTWFVNPNGPEPAPMDKWAACGMKTMEHGNPPLKYDDTTIDAVLTLLDSHKRVKYFRPDARQSFCREHLVDLLGVGESTADRLVEEHAIDSEIAGLTFYKLALEFNAGD